MSAWLAHRGAVRPFMAPLFVMLAVYLLSLAVTWMKYSRFAAYHAHSARVVGRLLWLAMGVAITLVLPR